MLFIFLLLYYKRNDKSSEREKEREKQCAEEMMVLLFIVALSALSRSAKLYTLLTDADERRMDVSTKLRVEGIMPGRLYNKI